MGGRFGEGIIGRILVLAAALPVAGSVVLAAEGSGIQTGITAPEFHCPLLAAPGEKAQQVTLGGARRNGEVVVLSFFHTTCKPCIREIPKLAKIIADRREAGDLVKAYLVFVGTEDDDTVRSFLKKHGFDLPVLMDRYGVRIGESYGVVRNEIAQVPQLMVVSKNGILKEAWRGFSAAKEEALPGIIASLAKETKAAAPSDTLTILFTNNNNGLVGPDPGSGLGGLARRGTVIDRERKRSPACIVLDSGDFLPTSPDEARSRDVVAACAKMDYDAVGIGETEFVNGLGFLRGVVKEGKLPFLSSNVKICKGEDYCADLVPSHRIFKVEGREIGVFSFMHQNTLGFAPKSRFKDGEWYIKWVDHVPPLKGFLSTFKGKVDLIVVLSHAGIDEDRRLAQEVEGIDVIVGGHSQTFLRAPEKVGNTVVVQAASDGRYVGKLVMKLGTRGAGASVQTMEMIAVTKDVPESARVKAVLSGAQ